MCKGQGTEPLTPAHDQPCPLSRLTATAQPRRSTTLPTPINAKAFTLQAVNMSDTAFRLRLAVAITSSCRQEFPAATALAVAMVMPLVILMDSSGDDVFSGTSFDWNTWKLEMEELKKVKKGRTEITYACPTGCSTVAENRTSHGKKLVRCQEIRNLTGVQSHHSCFQNSSMDKPHTPVFSIPGGRTWGGRIISSVNMLACGN